MDFTLYKIKLLLLLLLLLFIATHPGVLNIYNEDEEEEIKMRSPEMYLTCSTEMLNARQRFCAMSLVFVSIVMMALLRSTLMSFISKSYLPHELGIRMCRHFCVRKLTKRTAR